MGGGVVGWVPGQVWSDVAGYQVLDGAGHGVWVVEGVVDGLVADDAGGVCAAAESFDSVECALSASAGPGWDGAVCGGLAGHGSMVPRGVGWRQHVVMVSPWGD